MKRTDLEARIAALGWAPTGEMAGGTYVWAHSKKRRKVYVPAHDIIWDVTAERLLDEAEG